MSQTPVSPRGPRPVPTALIDEAECIGCTLCIQACPFDAIVGAAHRMHTVVESLCTGCRLCLPPCPVDCISIVAASPERVWTRAEAIAAGARVKAHKRRLELERLQRDARLASQAHDDAQVDIDLDDAAPKGLDRIAAIVARAVQRARKRRSDGTA
jgi:electron transport complex protein RnfB